MNKKFYMFKNVSNKVGELYIYNEIASRRYWEEHDVTSPDSFKKGLEALGDIETLNVYINSPGGSVFAGVAIGNLLKRHKAKVNVYVDGYAASIASVIVMAADKIHMYKNSMLMIHNPWTIVAGNSKELRKVADDLDSIRESLVASYMDKATEDLLEDKLLEMLDDETWLSAEDSKKYFGVTIINEDSDVEDNDDNIEVLSKYRRTPKALINAKNKKKVDKTLKDKLKNELIKHELEMELLKV